MYATLFACISAPSSSTRASIRESWAEIAASWAASCSMPPPKQKKEAGSGVGWKFVPPAQSPGVVPRE